MTDRVLVRASDYAVAGSGSVLAALGLGSCVVVALYDAGARVAGLAHPLLPEPPSADRGAPPARYASRAVPLLVRAMLDAGASEERIDARLVGGATMFAPLLGEAGRTLGARNADAVRRALAEAGVPVRAEELGGERGRSVFLDADDGSVRITSVGHADIVL